MNVKLMIVLVLSMLFIGSKCGPSFKAAVYEHIPLSEEDSTEVENLELNLVEYLRAIGEAATNGAKIIVTPENSLIKSLDKKRENLKKFFSDASYSGLKTGIVPCKDLPFTKNNIVLVRLSCAAKYKKIIVVFNFGSKVQCDQAFDDNCPEDGFYLFNTNIVLGPEGQVLTSYFKKYLFGENYFDAPAEFPFTTFDTQFGKFGVLSQYDIYFKEARELVQKYGVTTIALTNHWNDQYPLGLSTNVPSGFARSQNVNVLSANAHECCSDTAGSGIFAGNYGAVNYTSYRSNTSVLLMSTIPVNPKSSNFVPDSFTDEEPLNLMKSWGGYFPLSPYKNLMLTKPAAKITFVAKGMNCTLSYKTKDGVIPRGYFLAAYNGDLKVFPKKPFAVQSCIFIYLSDPILERKPMVVFDKFEMTGNFSKSAIDGMIPSVLTNVYTLANPREWSYKNGTIKSTGGMTRPLRVAALLGRDFDNDRF